MVSFLLFYLLAFVCRDELVGYAEAYLGTPSALRTKSPEDILLFQTSTARSLSMLCCGIVPVGRLFIQWISDLELDSANSALPLIAVWVTVLITHEISSYLLTKRPINLFHPGFLCALLGIAVLNRSIFVAYIAVLAATGILRSLDYITLTAQLLFPTAPVPPGPHWFFFITTTQWLDWMFKWVDYVELAGLFLLLVQTTWQDAMDPMLLAFSTALSVTLTLPDHTLWARRAPIVLRDGAGNYTGTKEAIEDMRVLPLLLM